MKLVAVLVMIPFAARADDFVTMDRQSDKSTGGLDVTFVTLHADSALNDPATVEQLDLHAAYVDPATHIGAYFNAPMTRVDNGSSPVTTDDFEVGGIYAPDLGDPRFGAVLHAGHQGRGPLRCRHRRRSRERAADGRD